MRSTVVQYNSWHTGAGIKRTGKKTDGLGEGEDVGDGRAEGSPTIGDRVIVVQSVVSPALCDSTDCSTPGFPVFHYLLEFPQTHVQRVGDAIRPSHPLLKDKQQFHSRLTLMESTFKSSQLEGSYAGEILCPIPVPRPLVKPNKTKPFFCHLLHLPFLLLFEPSCFLQWRTKIYVPVTRSGERTPWDGQPSTYLET